MSNVIKVQFGEERNEPFSVKEEVAALQAPPWNLAPRNAELLALEMYAACDRYNKALIANSSLSWHTNDPPEILSQQLAAYSQRLRAIAFDEMTKLFYLTLAYGTHEQPRGYP